MPHHREGASRIRAAVVPSQRAAVLEPKILLRPARLCSAPVEDVPQGGGEGVRLAPPAALAAEEAAVVAREDDGLSPESLGDGERRPVSHLALGLGPGSDHDASRHRAECAEIVPVARPGQRSLAEREPPAKQPRPSRDPAADRVVLRLMARSGRALPTPAPTFHYDIETHEYESPTAAIEQPWELTRGLGNSFGYNAHETAAETMSGQQLVHLLPTSSARAVTC